MQNVIIKPVITEKSMKDAAKGRFTFIVGINATKTLIKEAVEKRFNVHVVGTTTVVVKGKTIRVGKRRAEKALQPNKKAIVALKTGEKIGLFELQK
jgi:large subunit ribosomal protein L23